MKFEELINMSIDCSSEHLGGFQDVGWRKTSFMFLRQQRELSNLYIIRDC